LAVLADCDVSFKLWAGDVEGHASSLACDERFTKGSRGRSDGGDPARATSVRLWRVHAACRRHERAVDAKVAPSKR
jgi:hypothetical protein